jgi:hypothetical protein
MNEEERKYYLSEIPKEIGSSKKVMEALKASITRYLPPSPEPPSGEPGGLGGGFLSHRKSSTPPLAEPQSFFCASASCIKFTVVVSPNVASNPTAISAAVVINLHELFLLIEAGSWMLYLIPHQLITMIYNVT